MVAKLLQRTAAQYQAAVQSVLKEWQPACGCHRPGAYPQCEACPCLTVFEQLIRQKLQSSLEAENHSPSGIHGIYDPTAKAPVCVSPPQV